MWNDAVTALRFEYLGTIIKFLYGTSLLWLPIFLSIVFLNIWLKYTRAKAVIKDGGTLLEIKLPRDVFKSPLAMEIILTSLYQSGKGTYLDTFVEGKHRPWFSLEIVSIDGEVRFFIWTKTKFKQLIESQFYAQYPGVEIYEVEDYSKSFFIDPEKNGLVGLAFKLNKPDIYPIKTYIDYGLDREQEEESKVDPMTSVLEFMGSIKAGEQIWIQILIQAHRKLGMKEDAVFAKEDWKKAGEAEIKKKIAEITGGDDEDAPRRAPTMGEKETISALERSLTKLPFEVGVRCMYVFRKEVFDPINITGLLGSFRQYSSQNLNEIRIAKGTGLDYPWEDFMGMRKAERERKILNAYKLRSYFQAPYKHLFTKPFILTTEELATIFHLPGKVVGTPTLTKISSRKSEAPSNLPI